MVIRTFYEARGDKESVLGIAIAEEHLSDGSCSPGELESKGTAKEVHTILIDDLVCLDLENLLKSACRQSRSSLSGRPRRKRGPDTIRSRTCPRAKDLVQVGKGNGIGRSPSARVEAVTTGTKLAHRLWFA